VGRTVIDGGSSAEDGRTTVGVHRADRRRHRRDGAERSDILVVPVLVAERKGPIEAVQESVQLFKRTRGEDLLAGIGFGGFYFLWSLPGMFAFVAGMIATHLIMAIIIMLLALLYFPLLGLVFSTMSTIFDVVLYRYATGGTITPGFDRELLEASFVSKSI